MAIDTRVPVTILTGFLGAGKTTLLNHLISSYPDKKIAIIENEFGEIGIDNELVIRPENGIFELSNGCICCTLNEELITTLENLLNSQHKFNHLLIETTGIAEPDAIAAAFLATPDIQRTFKVDAVVCIADAHHLTDILDEREEARKQLTFADFVVLNKASEVTPEYLQSVKTLLKQVNPFAAVEAADYCQIKTNVLELNAYAADVLETKIKGHTDHVAKEHHGEGHTCNEHCNHHDHDHKHEHKHEHKHDDKHECDEHCDHDHEHTHAHKHHHHSDIVSESFVFDTPIDMLKFRQWINVVLLIQKQSIYRIKGILNFAWHEEKMVFQSVQELFAFQRAAAWGETERRQSRIVFIGKNLRREILDKSLRQCYYKPEEYETLT
jgi:G3E family GTPase